MSSSWEESLDSLKTQVVDEFNKGVEGAPAKIIDYVEKFGTPKDPNPANTGTKPGGPSLGSMMGGYFWWIVGGLIVLALVVYGSRRRKL